MFRCIIAGSRDFDDYPLLQAEVCMFLDDLDSLDVEIISGCAKGADSLGERFASDWKLPVKKFPANWDKYGKRAGILRNCEMAKYATHCIVFIVNGSKGSSHMIQEAKKQGLTVKVVEISR